MTVFRKLTALDYISSYSHSGKYYSLKRIARYNKYGIWSHEGASFSRSGTLKKTIEFLMKDLTKGYSVLELRSYLKVKVEDILLELVKDKTVARKKMSGIFIYFSTSPNYVKNKNSQELIKYNIKTKR